MHIKMISRKTEDRNNNGRLRWTPFVNALAKAGLTWDWDSEWEVSGELTLWHNGKVLSVNIEWDDGDDFDRYDIPRTLVGYRFVSEDESIPNEEIDKLNDLPNTPAIVRSLCDYVDRYGSDA